MKEKKNIYEILEEEIIVSDLPANEKNERLSHLIRMREKKCNIILIGAAGSGKSSTVNALFNMEVAKVGVGADPETSDITSYTLDNLAIWDTPGIGDGVKSDARYCRTLINKLSETDKNGEPLIDLVMVVLDASSKDLGASFDLINNVVMSYMEAYIKNDTTILFMRTTEDFNKPFITIEIFKNRLTQDYHRYNKDCSNEEAEWIRQYCRRHGIDVGKFAFNAEIDDLA